MASWFDVSRTQNPTKLKKIFNTNVGQRDRAGWTALMHAASSDNVLNIQFLLDSEKNIHTPSNFTALMVATERGFVRAVRCLLCQAGQRVTQNDPKYKAGTTALAIAAECGNRQIFDILLNYEREAADLSDLHVFAFQHLPNSCLRQVVRQDILGRLPIVYAIFIQETTLDYKNLLINLIQAPQLKQLPVYDSYGLTPLHYAVIYNNPVAVSLLAPVFSGFGTTQNCKSFKLNTTALMLAVFNENLELAQLLCKYESNLQDEDGQNALNHLMKHKMGASQNQGELIELLRSTTAKSPVGLKQEEREIQEKYEREVEQQVQERVISEQVQIRNSSSARKAEGEQKMAKAEETKKFEVKAPSGHESLEESIKHSKSANSPNIGLKLEDLQSHEDEEVHKSIVKYIAQEQLEISNAQNKIQDLESELIIKNKKIEELCQKEIESEIKREKQFKQIQNDLENEKLKYDNLHVLYEQQAFELKIAEVQQQSLNQQVKEHIETNQKCLSSNQELQSQLQQMLAQLEATQNSLEVEQQRGAECQEKYYESQKQLAGAKQIINEQNETIRQLQEELLKYQENELKLKQELQYKDQEIVMYEAAVQEINGKIQSLEKSVAKSQMNMSRSIQQQPVDKELVNNSVNKEIKEDGDTSQLKESDIINDVKEKVKQVEFQTEDVLLDGQKPDSIKENLQQSQDKEQTAIHLKISQNQELEQQQTHIDENKVQVEQKLQNLQNSQKSVRIQESNIIDSKVNNAFMNTNNSELTNSLVELKDSKICLEMNLKSLRESQNYQKQIQSLQQQIQEMDLKLVEISTELSNEQNTKLDLIQKLDQQKQDIIELCAKFELKEGELKQITEQADNLKFSNEMLQGELNDEKEIDKILTEDNKLLSENRVEQEKAYNEVKKEKQLILDEYTEVKAELLHINDEIKEYGSGINGVKILLEKLKTVQDSFAKLKLQCKEWMDKILD